MEGMFRVVFAFRVGRRQNSDARLELVHNPGLQCSTHFIIFFFGKTKFKITPKFHLCDADGLLFHRFVDGGAVVLLDARKFVDTTNPTVRQD